jgi:hypothetical protein
MVYAEDYAEKALIPVDTKATVKTDRFEYTNIIYNSKVDSNGNSLITFESIKNNTITEKPISINILLFGEDQRNIGFLTYCTDKDYDSNYSYKKLSGESSIPFSINVISKYFVDGKGASDVKYISVYDDNKYCQVGGYDKYKGLTIDEIVNGVINKNDSNSINKLISELQEKGIMQYVIIGLIALIVLIVIIMIISKIVKSNRIRRIEEIKVDSSVPMEETVDLSYSKVEDDDGFEEDSVSMGEFNNTIEEDNEENNEEKEEDEDLTKFFN